MKSKKEMKLFIDGSSTDNMFAGYSFYIDSYQESDVFESYIYVLKNNIIIKTDTDKHVTNARAELFAFCKGFEYIIKNKIEDINIEVVGDSTYILNSAIKWIDKWKRENTLTTRLNNDLLIIMDKLILEVELHNIVTYKHVKSHTRKADNIYWRGNNLVDLWAKKSSTDKKKYLYFHKI